MSSKGFSGKGGNAKGGEAKICDLLKWSFTELAKIGKYVSNCTGGAHAAVVGATDSNGTFEVAIPSDGKIPFKAGDAVSLELDVGPSGVAASTNDIVVPVVINDLKIEVDLGGEAPVTAAYSFEGAGPPVYSGILSAGAGNCCGVAPGG